MQEISNSLAFGRSLPLASRGLRTQRGLLSGVGATLSLLGQAVAAIRRNGGTLIGIPDNFAGAYIDSTGTQPVTAVGDLVGKLNSQTNSNHATQPTTASKPVVTRVPKRLGPNLVVNGDFSAGTAGWDATNTGTLAVSGGLMEITCSGSGYGAAMRLMPLTVGKTYWVQASSPDSGVTVRLNHTTTSTALAALPLSANTQSTPYTATESTVSVAMHTNSNVAGTKRRFGPISVREVLEWTNAISFDGFNDFLQTGITTGNEGWVCAGVTFGVNAVGHAIFGNGASSSADVGVMLRTASSNNAATLLLSDGTTRQIVSASPSNFTGLPKVMDAGWDAATMLAALDGAETSLAKTVNCTTAKACTFGGSATLGWYLNGPMTAIIYTPVLPNALDRARIRKWVGSLQGQTL